MTIIILFKNKNWDAPAETFNPSLFKGDYYIYQLDNNLLKFLFVVIYNLLGLYLSENNYLNVITRSEYLFC